MATLKQLKKALKKAGLKTSGSKRALTRRANKAHLMRGGDEPADKKEAKKAAEAAVQSRLGEMRAQKAEEEDKAARSPPPTTPAPTPGGSRKRKQPKKPTKKRPTRQLTASAYRW